MRININFEKKGKKGIEGSIFFMVFDEAINSS